MRLIARARHVVARRPWLYWLVVVALAGGVGLITAGAVAEIDDARRSWGETRPVLVASRSLNPGEALEGRTDVQSRPIPMVPDDAIERMAPGAVARQHVAAGEVLVDADVVSGSLPAALIPAGWRGVPVAEAVPSGAGVGDRVAVAARERSSPPTAWSSATPTAGRSSPFRPGTHRAWRTPRRAASWCCSCSPDPVSPGTRRRPGSGPARRARRGRRRTA